ncbi:MAG TPA: class III extradiol ring-cleavage dioxygenase [Thermoplasmata archaeon]|jgi:aromatic ring-opening dioxygenase catalytic subunit (LigB family)|nr:class III extradiol ring-cleavage dioxygenase [Thermoplasmata archaeon]
MAGTNPRGPTSGRLLGGIFAPNAPNLIDPAILGVGGEATVRALRSLDIEKRLRPDAILVASPHWLSRSTFLVDTSPRPRFIEDFEGFPREMYGHRYEPPGDPVLARALLGAGQAAGVGVSDSEEWGLDHGAWTALAALVPSAKVPVVPLSYSLAPPADHLRWGRAIAAGVEASGRSVVFVATGQILHNFSKFSFGPEPARWPEGEAIESEILERMLANDVEGIAEFDRRKWREAAPEGGLGPYFLLAGALGGRFAPRLVSNERSFGSAGMTVLEYVPLAGP